MEPHSPVPYLVLRCDDLGNMPFPKLLSELVRDTKMVGDINRELGIKEAGPPPKK
jgi:hypothetical protein